MRNRTISPEAYRRVTGLALAALVFIIVTGGAVRLTGSGLGCSDWPTCEQDQLVAPLEYHALVEFVNRLITGVVSVAVVAAVAGSFWRAPRRRDLTRWSLGLVAGVVAQIVLGAFTVRFHLWPPLVMGHFLLSMVLVWNAVVLWVKAGEPDRAPQRDLGAHERRRRRSDAPRFPGEGRRRRRALVAAAAVAVFTGTLVTAAGPHGGDEEVARLPVDVPDVARLHGVAVVLFLALVLVTMRDLRRAGAQRAALARGEALLAVVVLQAGVGYTQYFTGVPVVLVGVHILGAATVWATTVWFHLTVDAIGASELRERVVA